MIDVNVLVSATLSGAGPSAQLVVAVRDGRMTAVRTYLVGRPAASAKGPPVKGNRGCRDRSHPNQKCASEVNRNRLRPRVQVSADATGVVDHAGARLEGDLADEVGFNAGLPPWRW